MDLDESLGEPANDAVVDFLPHQWRAITAIEPFVALVTGLGGGKTWTGARWILGRALAYPRSIHLVTVNSYPQAQDLVLPAIDDAAEEMGLSCHWAKRSVAPTLYVDLGDVTACIRVRSTEHFNKLRGPEYGSWWADEVRDAKRGAVPVVLGRLRCKKVDRPRYLWTTTPNGHDIIWERHAKSGRLIERRESKVGAGEIHVWRGANPDCLMVQADTRANPFLREGYADLLAQNYDPTLLAQERGGQFVVVGPRCYYAFEYARNVSPAATYSETDELFLALDFNVDPCVAVLIQERDGKTLVVDELILDDNGSTPGVIALFKSRYPTRTARRATIYGDASGRRRDTRSLTSDYEQWQQHVPGIGVQVPLANGPICDRLNAVNARCLNHKGEVRLLVNPKCVRTIADLEQVQPVQFGREPDKKRDPRLTHTSDALGYYVVARFPCEVPLDRERHATSDRRLVL